MDSSAATDIKQDKGMLRYIFRDILGYRVVGGKLAHSELPITVKNLKPF
jgi:hypothetical protein